MSLSIAPGAIVCNESVLIGDISIGSRTVVHPKVILSIESYFGYNSFSLQFSQSLSSKNITFDIIRPLMLSYFTDPYTYYLGNSKITGKILL
jgi:hypothetical protein